MAASHHSRHILLSLLTMSCLILSSALPAPGADLDGTASNGRAVIHSGDRYDSVYGITTYGNDARARYGRVVNDGGQSTQIMGGQAYGNKATTTYNSVVVNGGRVSDNVYGGAASGYLSARSNSNTVVQNGGVTSHIVGGNADSGCDTAQADSNLVLIRGGSTGALLGGYASGLTGATARYNLISITGGDITSVVGGDAATTRGTADASFNAVLINGGSVKGNVIGGLVHMQSTGQSVSARYNAITLVNGTIDGEVYGSAVTDSNSLTTPLDGAGSGNSLNLLGWQGTLRRVAAFQHLNLALPDAMPSGATLLTLGGGQQPNDLKGATVRMLGALGSNGLRSGDQYILLRGTGAANAALYDNGVVRNAPKGFALLFDGIMTQENDAVRLTVTGVRSNPQLKAFNEYRVAAMTTLDRGARLVEGVALDHAREAAAGREGWMPFAAVYGGTERNGTEEYADSTGLALTAGLARHMSLDAGDLLLGVFFEYGQARIATSNEFSVGDVYGDGDVSYAGGGAFGRFDLGTGPLAGLYAQGGLRLGQVNGGWNTADIASTLQQDADFGTTTAYYGLFASLGYAVRPVDRLTLDSRASFFWTHQDGQDISIMGEDFRLEAMDSCLLRLGTRVAYEMLPGVSPYVGAAWEHQFDGTARTQLLHHGADAPSVSMRGDSAVISAGLQLTPGSHPLRADLGIEAVSGVRQGFGGHARLVWEF